MRKEQCRRRGCETKISKGLKLVILADSHPLRPESNQKSTEEDELDTAEERDLISQRDDSLILPLGPDR